MLKRNLFKVLYNPKYFTEKELIDSFIIRNKEFSNIFKEVKEEDISIPGQNYLIQGQRGSGKTMLLFRLYYEIKKINKNLIPVIFNEEEYGIISLFKLWEEVALRLEEEYDEFQGIVDEMEEVKEQEDLNDSLSSILNKYLKNRRIVLLIDNFNEMLNKFDEKENRRLREILITNSSFKIIGASSEVMYKTFEYDQPFYEFFKLINLNNLSLEEVRSFLFHLAEHYPNVTIEKEIEESVWQIEALRILAGGVPRIMIMLFEILLNEEKGSFFENLKIILDRITPFYKHRMDSLKKNQQAIINIVAMNWEATGVKEITEITKIESKTVSAQLNSLVKNNLITKIPTNNKNYLYQLEDRFFNIWYIMRYGRKKEKYKLKCFVEFIENWSIEEELKNKCNKKIPLFFDETLLENKYLENEKNEKFKQYNEEIIENYDFKSLYDSTISLIVNDDILEGLFFADKVFNFNELYKDNFNKFIFLIQLLLAKGQINYIMKIFEKNDNKIKEIFLPLYYALVVIEKEKYQEEYYRIPIEFNELINKMLINIKEIKEEDLF